MKFARALFVAAIVAVVLFGFAPMIPDLIHDIVLITWAMTPWQGRLILLAMAGGIIWAIIRIIFKAVRWLIR